MSVTSAISVRSAKASDVEAIARIYNHFVDHTVVTFEEQPVAAAEMARRVAEVQSAALLWLVAEEDGEVIGYANSSKWNVRCAYRFTAELSVYIAPAAQRHGAGEALYRTLIADISSKDYHTIIGGIALPNEASVRLHEKLGFRKVAHFTEVGYKFGNWVDVGYWEKVADGPAATK